MTNEHTSLEKYTSHVVYWPLTRPNMPFQRRGNCIFHWRGRAWLTIWNRVKIPRYSHKLIHRKRGTCELHDSYFRSMTIKHAIPKTAEVHIPMASYGEILSGREQLYNSVLRKFNQLETRCGRDSQHPAEGALRPPINEFGDQKSWRNDAVEKTAPSKELGPRASGWATLEDEKEMLMAIRVGVNMLQFCSVSNSLSHTNLSNKVRGKNCVARLYCFLIIVSFVWRERNATLTLYSKWLWKGCERVMCERWVEDWTNCNILIPSSFFFSSTSFSFCWATQSGVLRAHSPLLGASSLYSILSPTNWLQTNWTCLWPRVI